MGKGRTTTGMILACLIKDVLHGDVNKKYPEAAKVNQKDFSDEDEYLEFNITKSPVTGETILLITDFCDDDEVNDQKAYWDNQIKQLRTETGG